MNSLKERRWIRFCGNKSFSYKKLQRLSFCCSIKERDWRSLSAPITSSRRGNMKYLLTSAGIKNTSIHDALIDLLGKPIAESSALCIPTAIYPFPGGPSMAYRFISGLTANPMCELGWKSLGVLELTALPSIKEAYWIAAVQETDALLVQGGDVWYLCRWMRESGLAELL